MVSIVYVHTHHIQVGLQMCPLIVVYVMSPTDAMLPKRPILPDHESVDAVSYTQIQPRSIECKGVISVNSTHHRTRPRPSAVVYF
jgi:hypothetical protein